MAQATPHNSILKDTREAKGLTLEIVHEATKVPMDALKAIEQGYSVRILTPFYYRGFIKIYAEFLGLDVAQVFTAYNITQPSRLAIPAMEKRAPAKNALPRRAPVPKQPRLAVPNPALEKFQDLSKGIFTPRNSKLVLRIAGGLLILFFAVKIGGCVAGHIKAKPRAKAIIVTKTKEKKQEAKNIPVVEVAPAASEATIKASSPNSHKVHLVVRARKSNFIQVKSDGKVVFAATMQKGTMESWAARDQIELSGRSINELELEVNGKNLGSLGSRERHAKRVVITKDGLTVKK